MFILNLAISDLLLCTVTMPFTLMEIVTKYFPWGNYPFLCKMLGPLQATSIFVSTISITAIALDRYQVSKKLPQLRKKKRTSRFIKESKKVLSLIRIVITAVANLLLKFRFLRIIK